MTDKILITPAELTAMLPKGGLVVIDTRAPDAYAAGHIPGAVNMHEIFTTLAMSTPDALSSLRSSFADAFGAAGLGGEETAVIYEGSMNTGFGQSCRGYFLLQWLGYAKACILHGGLQAWTAAGGATTTEPTVAQPRTFPLTEAGAKLMIDSRAMLAAVDDDSVIKLDVRDVDEWIGTSSSPYGPDFCPRKGRIPNARWLEWYRLMKPTASGPMFKSPDEIRAELQTVGVQADSKVFLYCFKGARASNSLVALREAGVQDVSMYFGSWNEWSRDDSLPIETGMPFKTAERMSGTLAAAD